MATSDHNCPHCGAVLPLSDRESVRCGGCGKQVPGSIRSRNPIPPPQANPTAPPVELPPSANVPPIESPPSSNLPSNSGSVAPPEAAAEKPTAEGPAITVETRPDKKKAAREPRRLRRLSPEEITIRRARMNVIMLSLGFAVLVATLVFLLKLTWR